MAQSSSNFRKLRRLRNVIEADDGETIWHRAIINFSRGNKKPCVTGLLHRYPRQFSLFAIELWLPPVQYAVGRSLQ